MAPTLKPAVSEPVEPVVRGAIGNGRPEVNPRPCETDDAPEPQSEPLHPVHPNEVADRAGREAFGGQPSERSRAGQLFDLGPKRVHVLPVDRRCHVRDRLLQGLRPGGVRRPRLQQPTDGRPLKELRRDVEVQVVVGDLPAAADDATRRKIEPGHPPADLDLLAAGEPVAVLVERTLQNDADVLQLAVEIRRWSEAEAKPDQLGGRDVDGQDADHEGAAEVAGPNLDLVDRDLAVGRADGERIGERVVVRLDALRRQRMDRVAHLVALADPDAVAEIVGDDTEVVAVVDDVGGQEGAVAPSQDDLLATVRCSPIHFHVELIRLDQTGRLGQPLADLGQEEHESVGPCPVARERRISLNNQPSIYRSVDERERPGRVPFLTSKR